MKSITEEMTLEDMEIVFTLWQRKAGLSFYQNENRRDNDQKRVVTALLPE